MCPSRMHLEIGFGIKNPYSFAKRPLIMRLSLPTPEMVPGWRAVIKAESFSLWGSKSQRATCTEYLQKSRCMHGARYFQ